MTDTPVERTTDRREPVDLQDEIQKSYLDYAMSVIVGRALPDVRDGLKPVHRRILYGMYDGGYRPDRGWNKCARVVGEVMGQYHPHGDGAIYDTLVRLAQPWVMRYPLVSGQGNFGSPGNDKAAAMRYTECKMAPLAMEMVRDITENTVDFKPNYDGKEQEPVVLPARFPNLLVNGSTGIAVGMATNIPTHNLREVAAAVQWSLDHPDAAAEELLEAAMERVLGSRLPQRRADRRPPRHRGRVPHRSRLGDHARGGRDRGGPRRAYVAGGHPAAAHGQPGQPGAQDRRAGQHRQAQRHRRHPRRHLGPDRPAAGHRAPPRRPAPGRAEQPLQAHPAAGHVRLQHAGAGRRRAAYAPAGPVHLLLDQPPDRGHPAADPAPAGRRAGAGPHLPRPGQGAGRAGRGDRA